MFPGSRSLAEHTAVSNSLSLSVSASFKKTHHDAGNSALSEFGKLLIGSDQLLQKQDG